MDINYIIVSNITEETPVATLPGFGVHAILCQFPTSKTVATFGRHRYYSSISEMNADGWADTDAVLMAARSAFSQNPRTERVMVGRIDSGDASITASAEAIRAEQDDWYTFEVVGNRGVLFTLSTALIAGNSVSGTINGTAFGPVVYAASHASTMGALKTAIETALGTGTVATVSGNTMSVVKPGTDLSIGTLAVTLGASQPTVVTTYPLDATKTKAWMAWTATQKKVMGFDDTDPASIAANTGVSGTACLLEFAKISGYKRVFGVYRVSPGTYPVSGWAGAELPHEVGKRQWAFRNVVGQIADPLTTSMTTNLMAKNANFYSVTANYSHMYAGTMADGTQIDEVRGMDSLDSSIKVGMFNMQVAAGKLPITDPGYQVAYGTLRGILVNYEDKGVLVKGASTVTVPLAANVSAEDKAAGKMTGIRWSGYKQVGALRIFIDGTVSV